LSVSEGCLSSAAVAADSGCCSLFLGFPAPSFLSPEEKQQLGVSAAAWPLQQCSRARLLEGAGAVLMRADQNRGETEAGRERGRLAAALPQPFSRLLLR